MLREAKSEQIHGCASVDRRTGWNSETEFRLEPCSGSLFLFCGKRRDRMKALLWEGD